MGALTMYGRSVLVNSVFRPEAAPMLSTAWLALTTLTPVSTDSGSSIVEPTASSYERSPYGIGTYFWSLMGPGLLINTRTLDWIRPTDDWGQVIGWALCTESTSGMALAYGRLRRPMTIVAGSRVRVPPGSIRLTLQ
jgi:hypothetical protein